MKKLIEHNYASIVKRGHITPETDHSDFILKLEEEVREFIEAVKWDPENIPEELADVILVCLAYAKHYDIQIENELLYKIGKNYQRED